MEEKNLEFRAVEHNDFNKLVEWEKEATNLGINPSPFPYSSHTIHNFIDNAQLSFKEKGMYRFIVEEKYEGVIGFVDFYLYNPISSRAKIGYFVDKKHRNKGYGYILKKFIIDYSFNTLNLHQLYWEIYSDNENSLKLTNKFKEVRKIGIKKDWVWKNGKYIDSHQFQIINNKTT